VRAADAHVRGGKAEPGGAICPAASRQPSTLIIFFQFGLGHAADAGQALLNDRTADLGDALRSGLDAGGCSCMFISISSRTICQASGGGVRRKTRLFASRSAG
jgi:hypothetical protein